MKKLMLIIAVMLIAANLGASDVKNSPILTKNTVKKKLVRVRWEVKYLTWCGVMLHYYYNPSPGESDETIESNIDYINYVMEGNACSGYYEI